MATGRCDSVPAVYRRILVGTDGSDTAGRAVRRAVEVAAATGATLTILSAGATAKAGRVATTAAAEHASSGVVIDTKAVDGDAVHALIDTAKAGGYDLVVVGNKGMTGITRFFRLGSVPNKLSHHLPTSMLVVHTT